MARRGGYPASIDLKFLTTDQGVIIRGALGGGRIGCSVGLAGDFNTDGLSDIIIGACDASPLNRTKAGASYVIYGKEGGYPTFIDLANLATNQGVVIQGAAGTDHSGYSVGSAGDFNSDGLNDIIIGAPDVLYQAGSSYVVYGKKDGYQTPIDLFSLNADQGVIIQGTLEGDRFGSSVSLAGDFNGDNVSDVVIGAPYASPKDRKKAGTSYIIYGNNPLAPPTDVPTNAPTNGPTNTYNPTDTPTDSPTSNPTYSPTYSPTSNSTSNSPYTSYVIIGVSSGLAVIGTITVGLVVFYRDTLSNWISSRGYTPIKDDTDIPFQGKHEKYESH